MQTKEPEIKIETPPDQPKRQSRKKANGEDSKGTPTGALSISKPERKIAILGTTPTRMEGPIQDDSGWERWTIGPGGKDAHNWERLFEVHGVWPADFKDYLNELSKVEPPKQIVTMPQPGNAAETWEGALDRWFSTHKLDRSVIEGKWTAMVRLPREAILNRFPRRMWFSSSISWLIAQAIMEEATDIGLWGIDLEAGEEYISQFVGCAHLIDLARVLGINIHMPTNSGLLRDPTPYPDRYETHLAMTFEKKVKWIQGALGQLEPQFDILRCDANRYEGRLLAYREVGADVKLIEEAEKNLVSHHGRIGALAANINQLKGELGATEFYRRMYVWSGRDPEDKT